MHFPFHIMCPSSKYPCIFCEHAVKFVEMKTLFNSYSFPFFLRLHRQLNTHFNKWWQKAGGKMFELTLTESCECSQSNIIFKFGKWFFIADMNMSWKLCWPLWKIQCIGSSFWSKIEVNRIYFEWLRYNSPLTLDTNVCKFIYDKNRNRSLNNTLNNCCFSH